MVSEIDYVRMIRKQIDLTGGVTIGVSEGNCGLVNVAIFDRRNGRNADYPAKSMGFREEYFWKAGWAERFKKLLRAEGVVFLEDPKPPAPDDPASVEFCGRELRLLLEVLR